MTTATAVNLYERLKPRLGADEARELIDYIAGLEERVFEKAETELATKGDIALLKGDMEKMEARLDAKLAQMETRLIRWMFAFWLGQFASLVAILFLFFK